MRVALLATGGHEDPLALAALVASSVIAASAAGADLICLPHLAPTPYFPATKDRVSLELAERPPSRSSHKITAAAGSSWVAMSVYESEGEGVFYATGYLGSLDGPLVTYRQLRVAAAHGQYEQMFWSPGHGVYAVVQAPWGTTGLLIGADLSSPEAWAALAGRGAQLVAGCASQDASTWPVTRRAVTGMAAVFGLSAFVANRGGVESGVEYPGDGLAVDGYGAEIAPDDDGLFPWRADERD